MARSRRPLATKDSAAPVAPPPDVTYDVEHLAREGGVTVRAVRYYIERGLLRAPEFRSWNTRYGRDYLLRLLAIGRLRREGLRLEAIRQRFDAASPEELLRLAGFEPPPEPLPEAAPVAPPPRPLPEGFLGPYRSLAARPSERWEHYPLCPGIQLLVRAEADGEAWRVAREIVMLFGAQPEEGNQGISPRLRGSSVISTSSA